MLRRLLTLLLSLHLALAPALAQGAQADLQACWIPTQSFWR